MKFWVKVRLNGEEDASELIGAFFKEFNHESSIEIKGKEAKVEIIFDNNPPMATIEAIKQCDVIEFYFGKVLGEYIEDETQRVTVEEEETSQQAKRVVEEETPQQTEQTKKKRVRSATKKVESTKIVSEKTVNIPQLEEIAKKATSFEHFAKLVAEWLEMGKKQEFFENLLMVASEVEQISWKELEKVLKDKGISCNQWDKIYTGQQVSEKLKAYSVKTISLLKAVREYKDYSFGHEKSEEGTLTQVEETTPKKRVKMECMPEIPNFEETLGSVDKTQPIEDRVRYVLNSMGFKKQNAEEQQEIFEIATTAVRIREINFDIIFSNANIPMESSMKARMTFSKFINDFVSEYDPYKKVKLLDFLKQLQEIIMHESEIKSLTACTD